MEIFPSESVNAEAIISERYQKFCYDCLYVAISILKDQSLAEDAIHDAFESVWKHKEQYSALPECDFRKLIIVIVKNKCRDILRRQRCEIDIADIPSTWTDGRDSVEDAVLKEIEMKQIMEYISRLDEKSLQILIMRYALNMSYKDISAMLDIKIKTVEVRIARAKKKVRSFIEKEERHEK